MLGQTDFNNDNGVMAMVFVMFVGSSSGFYFDCDFV
jgi:hypothetical protein